MDHLTVYYHAPTLYQHADSFVQRPIQSVRTESEEPAVQLHDAATTNFARPHVPDHEVSEHRDGNVDSRTQSYTVDADVYGDADAPDKFPEC